MSIALNAPLFANTDNKSKECCKVLYSDEEKLTQVTFVIFFLFIIPFNVISFCYDKTVRTVYNRSTVTPESNIPDKDKLRQRKQLLEMSLTVTAVFLGRAGTAPQTFRGCCLFIGKKECRSFFISFVPSTAFFFTDEETVKLKLKKKMENLGIDPGTSCMLSGRSTIFSKKAQRACLFTII